MEIEGEMVSSLVTGVSLKVLSSGMGERGPNEAAAWDRNFSSMVPHSVASLLAPGLLRWMRKRPQPKERFSCLECRSVCWGWERCPAGMWARWNRSPKTTLWGQKLHFSLRSTVEAINWLLAPFHCFLAAWVINCRYSCIRFILRETAQSFSRGVQLIPPACLIQGRDFSGTDRNISNALQFMGWIWACRKSRHSSSTCIH